jgi:ubiquinone biosynthesis protein Coq4
MAYVAQRFRQTHDLWHVITGCDTDAASEVTLQAFTFAQTGAPSAGVLAALGSVRGRLAGIKLGRASRDAYRAGRAARYLGAFPWEDHWATPLGELRRMLGISSITFPRPET